MGLGFSNVSRVAFSGVGCGVAFDMNLYPVDVAHNRVPSRFFTLHYTTVVDHERMPLIGLL